MLLQQVARNVFVTSENIVIMANFALMVIDGCHEIIIPNYTRILIHQFWMCPYDVNAQFTLRVERGILAKLTLELASHKPQSLNFWHIILSLQNHFLTFHLFWENPIEKVSLLFTNSVDKITIFLQIPPDLVTLFVCFRILTPSWANRSIMRRKRRNTKEPWVWLRRAERGHPVKEGKLWRGLRRRRKIRFR